MTHSIKCKLPSLDGREPCEIVIEGENYSIKHRLFWKTGRIIVPQGDVWLEEKLNEILQVNGLHTQFTTEGATAESIQ